jgi:hypothetical protein
MKVARIQAAKLTICNCYYNLDLEKALFIQSHAATP